MDDSLELTLEAIGEEQIKTMLTDLGLDLKDLKGAMNEVGKSQIKYFSGNVFASRGSTIAGAQRWPRLSEPYASRKAKKYPGRGVLVATGTMKNSFKHSASNMSVTIYNTDRKFRYHQSTEPRKKIPRRAMLGVYNGMQKSVTTTIAQTLAEKVKRRAG